jgi:hypothetical protein
VVQNLKWYPFYQTINPPNTEKVETKGGINEEPRMFAKSSNSKSPRSSFLRSMSSSFSFSKQKDQNRKNFVFLKIEKASSFTVKHQLEAWERYILRKTKKNRCPPRREDCANKSIKLHINEKKKKILDDDRKKYMEYYNIKEGDRKSYWNKAITFSTKMSKPPLTRAIIPEVDVCKEDDDRKDRNKSTCDPEACRLLPVHNFSEYSIEGTAPIPIQETYIRGGDEFYIPKGVSDYFVTHSRGDPTAIKEMVFTYDTEKNSVNIKTGDPIIYKNLTTLSSIQQQQKDVPVTEKELEEDLEDVDNEEDEDAIGVNGVISNVSPITDSKLAEIIGETANVGKSQLQGQPQKNTGGTKRKKRRKIKRKSRRK